MLAHKSRNFVRNLALIYFSSTKTRVKHLIHAALAIRGVNIPENGVQIPLNLNF